MPNAGTFETWRTARDGLRWIAPPARSTGQFETWLSLRGAPTELALTPQAVSATGLRSGERVGLAGLIVGQSIAPTGIPTAERLGSPSLSLAAAYGVAVHHVLSDRPRFAHAVSDGG